MKRLVIDASVACGAGSGATPKPPSKASREFLMEVRDSGHFLILTDSISAEWKDHAAKFARTWRTSMFAKKRVEKIDIPAFPGLQKRIRNALANDGEREAADKDHHLLLAALHSDQTIASLDDTVRRLFARVCPAAAEVCNVVWVNPDKEDETPLDWLRDDAPADHARKLAQFPHAQA